MLFARTHLRPSLSYKETYSMFKRHPYPSIFASFKESTNTVSARRTSRPSNPAAAIRALFKVLEMGRVTWRESGEEKHAHNELKNIEWDQESTLGSVRLLFFRPAMPGVRCNTVLKSRVARKRPAIERPLSFNSGLCERSTVCAERRGADKQETETEG